jgi:MFS family permease
MGIGRFAFTPILPMMQEDRGLTVQHGAWIASANYLGYLLGALWTMVQRPAPAPAIRLSLLAASIATLAMAYADSLAPWLVLRFIAGVASAWALVNVSTWCFEALAQLRRPALNGVVFAGVGAGVAIAGLLCLLLLVRGAGSHDAWLACGVLGLAITFIVWPVLGRGGRAADPAVRAEYRWSGDAMRLVACYGAYGFGYIVPATFIPAMARQLIPDPVVFGWAWPLFGAAAVASTLLAGWLARWLSNRAIWMASALVMAAGVLAPLVVPGLAGILLSALLVGSTFVVITQVGVQEARAVAGASAGTLVAAMTSAFAAGQVLGPLAVSAVGGNFTYALAFSGALLAASAAALRLR